MTGGSPPRGVSIAIETQAKDVPMKREVPSWTIQGVEESEKQCPCLPEAVLKVRGVYVKSREDRPLLVR